MVQLEILSGPTAGTKWSTRRFPVHVGRAATADLQLEAHGVWDDHFEIRLEPASGFILQVHPDARVTINSQPAEKAALRNGDRIEFGAMKLRFWIAEARQRGLRIREGFVWFILLAVSLGQIALIYWLLQ